MSSEETHPSSDFMTEVEIRKLIDECLKEILEKFKSKKINEYEYIAQLERLLQIEKERTAKLIAENAKLKKALSKLLEL